MVAVNTISEIGPASTLRFTHLVDVPNSNCTIATAREEGSRRTKVYLYHFNSESIYQRNGIKGTWEKLGEENRQHVKHLIDHALTLGNIPRWSIN